MDGYREHRLSKRGVGNPGPPTPPAARGPGPHAGVWGNPISPRPHPREGLARTQGCGETRFPHVPTGGRAWPARRGVGKPGFPTPHPREGKGAARAQGDGETRCPHAPTGERAWPARRGVGTPGFSTPHPREGKGAARAQGDRETRFPHVPTGGRAWPARRGTGTPGVPIPSPGGRVWEGAARAQGCGDTGCPHSLTRWESLGGRRPRAGVWGHRVPPFPHPVGGFGRAAPQEQP